MTSRHILRHMTSFDRPSCQEVDRFINDNLLKQKRRDQKLVRQSWGRGRGGCGQET